MLEKLTHTDFEKHLNTNFKIFYAEDEWFDATLIEVDTLGKGPEEGSDMRWSFAIVLHVPEKEKYLVQRIFKVEHDALGTLELFLVPLGPDATGFRYEAVFT